MIIAAVVVFILCWLPFFIVNIVYFVKGSQHKRPCTESVPFLIVMWLAFSRYFKGNLLFTISYFSFLLRVAVAGTPLSIGCTMSLTERNLLIY